MDELIVGGESFSFMLNAKQGAYVMLGIDRTPDGSGVRRPEYGFNDDVLPVGASWYAARAEQALSCR